MDIYEADLKELQWLNAEGCPRRPHTHDPEIKSLDKLKWRAETIIRSTRQMIEWKAPVDQCQLCLGDGDIVALRSRIRLECPNCGGEGWLGSVNIWTDMEGNLLHIRNGYSELHVHGNDTGPFFMPLLGAMPSI